jgi:dipeptidase D
MRPRLPPMDPKEVWTHFEEFTRIARCSGSETGIKQYIIAWANTSGFLSTTDTAGNLRVRIPARPGREARTKVVIQGHLDMVCTRDSNAGQYDPALGRIRIFRANVKGNDIEETPVGRWLKADKTTLGADDGVGVASMLALATDTSAVHGPLDLLFTVQEEAGLVGASQLDPALINGTTFLNVDSEEENVLIVGSAGGAETDISWTRPMSLVPSNWRSCSVSISGLLGGHSGVNINSGRLNAAKALVRIVGMLKGLMPFQIAEIQAGDRANAIPREARIILFVDAADTARAKQILEEATDSLKAQYAQTETNLAVNINLDESSNVLPKTFESGESLLDLLVAIPSGVVAMSQDIPGVVETSNNLGVIVTTDNVVKITCSSRSFIRAALNEVRATIVAISDLAGASCNLSPAYPGWKPDPQSKVLGLLKGVYQNLFGMPPLVLAVHAGLECGVIKAKIPAMDAVSFGPTIIGAHSTGERVDIDSVAKFYSLLHAVVGELAGKVAV